jgi:hypothetical protein
MTRSHGLQYMAMTAVLYAYRVGSAPTDYEQGQVDIWVYWKKAVWGPFHKNSPLFCKLLLLKAQ